MLSTPPYGWLFYDPVSLKLVLLRLVESLLFYVLAKF